MANYHQISFMGLQSMKDLIGLTKYDIWLDPTVQKRKNLTKTIISNHIKSIQIDEKVHMRCLVTGRSESCGRLVLDDKGRVHFENFIKTGIPNHEYKIIAFLTVFLDFTHQIPLYKLFRLYQEFYPTKEAVQRFLKHFNIESYFDPLAPLTQKEIEVLISMREDSRCKIIANKFGCSVPTASNHISHINGKLTSGTLHDVLTKLRTISENAQSTHLCI